MSELMCLNQPVVHPHYCGGFAVVRQAVAERDQKHSARSLFAFFHRKKLLPSMLPTLQDAFALFCTPIKACLAVEKDVFKTDLIHLESQSKRHGKQTSVAENPNFQGDRAPCNLSRIAASIKPTIMHTACPRPSEKTGIIEMKQLLPKPHRSTAVWLPLLPGQS